MPQARPRGVLIRLTEEQFRLAKRRMALDDIGWQHLGQAAVNGYILGHLTANRRGEAGWDPNGDAATFSEDPKEAVRQVRAAVKGMPPPPPRKTREWWDLHDLARYLEESTGRRVGHAILRQYLRKHWSHLKDKPKSRWKFYPEGDVPDGAPDTGPKTISAIAAEVAYGDLDEFKARRFEQFGKTIDGQPLPKG